MFNRKTLIAIIFVLMMMGTSVATLANYIPQQNTTGNIVNRFIPETQSGNAYINSTLSGYTSATGTSGQTTLSAKQGSINHFYYDGTGTFSSTSGSIYTSEAYVVNLSSYPLYGELPSFIETSFEFDYNVGGELGFIQATLDLYPDGSGSYYQSTATYYYNSTSQGYYEISPAFSGSSYVSGYYFVVITISISAGGDTSFNNLVPAPFTIDDSQNFNGLTVQASPASTYYGYFPYTYSGVSDTVSFGNPSNTVALDYSWSTSIGGTSSSLSNGYYYSSVPTSTSFSQSGTPTVPSYTISWSTGTIVESESDVSDSGAITQSPAENQNWWNSSISNSVGLPSGWLDGSSVDGKNWNTVLNSYTVQHVLSIGYGTSAPVDLMYYSGTSSGSFNQPSQYESWSASPGSTENSAFTLSWNIAEFINYNPSIVNSHAVSPVNPLTPLVLYANGTEQISGEQQNLAWSPNGAPYSSSAPASSAAMQSSPFSFSSVGSKTISWYIHNDPNGNPISGAELDTSIQQATVNVLPFSLTPSPVDYSSVGTSVLLSLKYSTQTSALMSQIDLTVNSVLEDRFQPDLASGTVKYDFTQPVASPLLVTWTATDQFGYSQSITFQYGSNLTPAEYSNKVTVLQSPNATHSFSISLSGVPTGSGFYQQLLTIGNSTNPISKYGINTAGSNVQFTAQNGTLLYSWEQSVNSSALQVWVKNYYGNSAIDMQVLPAFENLFSATGYLGEAPQLSSVYNSSNNMLKVFPIAFAFTDHISNFWNYNSTSNAVNGVDGKDGLNFFVNSATTENVYITRHVNDLQNYYFGFTVSSYSNGSVLANWWNGTNTFQTGAITVNHIGNYVITNTINGATPIFDNDAVYPTYMTIPDIFFYSALTMPTFTIGTGSVFQANATTTSTFTGTSAGNYNSTYENMIYDIPIAPNTDPVPMVKVGIVKAE